MIITHPRCVRKKEMPRKGGKKKKGRVVTASEADITKTVTKAIQDKLQNLGMANITKAA